MLGGWHAKLRGAHIGAGLVHALFGLQIAGHGALDECVSLTLSLFKVLANNKGDYMFVQEWQRILKILLCMQQPCPRSSAPTPGCTIQAPSCSPRLSRPVSVKWFCNCAQYFCNQPALSRFRMARNVLSWTYSSREQPASGKKKSGMEEDRPSGSRVWSCCPAGPATR